MADSAMFEPRQCEVCGTWEYLTPSGRIMLACDFTQHGHPSLSGRVVPSAPLVPVKPPPHWTDDH